MSGDFPFQLSFVRSDPPVLCINWQCHYTFENQLIFRLIKSTVQLQYTLFPSVLRLVRYRLGQKLFSTQKSLSLAQNKLYI